MSDNKNETEAVKGSQRNKTGNVSGGIYGLAFLGALVYYLQHAATFGAGAIGVLKAIFWPAVLIYKVMEYLKM